MQTDEWVNATIRVIQVSVSIILGFVISIATFMLGIRFLQLLANWIGIIG